VVKYILILVIGIYLVGCSGKESILVPGQSESDCDGKASKLGVCGTPRTVYEHKDKIKNLWYEEDEAYYVKKNGKIYNIRSNEEVIPGVRPKGCNNAICPNCDTVTDEDHEHTSACNHIGGKGKNSLVIRNRSLIINTPQETTMMRDLGWQQKIWIAPMKTRGDDLVEAHGVHVVIKKPSWIIGEDIPKNVKRGVVVPSVIAREVLTDNHQAINREVSDKINNYIESEKYKSTKNLSKIENYIKTQKGKN